MPVAADIEKEIPGMATLPVKILLVEDDVNISNIVKFRLGQKGYQVQCIYAGDKAVTAIHEQEFDIVLLDISLPGRNGIEILQEIKQTFSLTQVIMMTANTSVDIAAQAMRYGAMDYIAKPIDFDRMGNAINKALDRLKIARRDLANQQQARSRIAFPTIIAESKDMKEVMNLVAKVSASNSPVLLLGENGTGKELVARTIHLKSQRASASFLSINCASLSGSLLESELFGNEEDTTTGANELRRGLLEVVNGGTLFMDEIGEMSPSAQVGLLKVLETGEFRRIRGRSHLHTDVRIIAATDRDLSKDIREKRFRQDLYSRLNAISITIPSLRTRKDDIWPLAKYFLSAISKETGCKKYFSDDVRSAFEKYSWPCNVRELRNALERLVILSEGDEIGLTDLPVEMAFAEVVQSETDFDLLPLEEVVKRHILKVLSRNKGSRRDTSRILNISEGTLDRKLKEYNVEVKSGGTADGETQKQEAMYIPGYQVISRLGEGGMGAVYKAKQLSLDRDVAIKVLSPSLANNGEFVERFKREAKAAGKLNHPNIVSVYETDQSDDHHYYVMEFVEGESLSDILAKRKTLPNDAALKIVEDVAKALQHALSQNIVHRDIKPANILLTKDGAVKLCDLGIAKQLAADPGLTLTSPGLVFGSPKYISPECAAGERADARSDIYSLGVTLYEMLTGKLPFTGATPLEIADKKRTQDPIPPKRLKADIPADLNNLVLKMMARNRDERYQSQAYLLADIARIKAGTSVKPSPQRIDRKLAIGVGAVAAVIALLIIFIPTSDSDKAKSNYPSAATDSDKTIELDKAKINARDALTYYEHGNEKLASGDYKGAIGDFDRSIELNPSDIDSYIKRGIAKYGLGDYGGEIRDLKKAVELAPSLKSRIQPSIDEAMRKLK